MTPHQHQPIAPAHRPRRALAAVGALAAMVGLVVPGPAQGAVPVLVLEGTGYGHGVGLSQWGAEFMARTGRSADQILTTFYPGAGLGQAGGTVRVAVHTPGPSATTLTFPDGGEVRSTLDGTQASGFPVRVGPGGRVRISFDGHYRVEALVGAQSGSSASRYRQDPCPIPALCPPTSTTQPIAPTTTQPTTTTTSPRGGGSTGGGSGGGATGGGSTDGGQPPATQSPPDPRSSSSQPVWAVPAGGGTTQVDDRGRAYRGVIEATGGGALRLVNQVGVEDYLRGMNEVPGTWPAPAIQAQAVAARTYALRAMQTGGELCDDARCQVYAGRVGETPGEDAAVAATAGRVLTYEGRLAAAVYSAEAGGVSATTMEGFGTPDGVYPYLKTVRYETDNPLPWRVEVALTDLAGRLGYAGEITAVRVGATGPSGRALDLLVSGTAGDLTVNALDFRASLGLRSTRFRAAIGTSDGTPPPLAPAAEAIQALPDDAAKLATQPLRPTAPKVERRERAGDSDGPGDVAQRVVMLAAAVSVAGLVGALTPLALAQPSPLGTVPDRARRALRRRAS